MRATSRTTCESRRLGIRETVFLARAALLGRTVVPTKVSRYAGLAGLLVGGLKPFLSWLSGV